MKIIDRLLLKSFLPPFSVTFFIALFVLIMQFLWKWIDDIAGKGVGLLFILEMLAYMCISLIPLALPIAVLISSVMVMGNLAERYELSSFKSAGVSLTRVMVPLMFLTFAISIFSYFCSDKLIPISNLKYQSRLYDIKNQKPTLSLEEGVFNDDFQGFSIRIGNKKEDNKTIENVLMYDQ
ncbi:MAG: LptF/LptG family permease, partial [Bacteroidota bacterium]